MAHYIIISKSSQVRMQHFMSYEKKTNSFNTSSNNNEDILKQFPKIKFSYESKPYKKVSQNNKSQSDTNKSNNDSEKNNPCFRCKSSNILKMSKE